MKNLTFAHRWNADLIDRYYETWVRDASQLDPMWNAFFEGFTLAHETETTDAGTITTSAGGEVDHKKQARVIGAIYAYRSIGHTQAQFNPLLRIPDNPRLNLERLGFNPGDLDERYDTGNYLKGQVMSVRELLAKLKNTYCGSIGVEYLHIQETPKRRWLQARMEPILNQPTFEPERRKQILDRVVAAEVFERFLHTRYVGQKRFSLEGGETIIACLDALLRAFPEHDIRTLVMGMAHRGRLNVLANIFQKSYSFIFREFSENYIPEAAHGDGDVKYHLGYDSKISIGDHEVELKLAANPSHLEAVNPIVEGRARAQQRILGDTVERKRVLPVLIHGDAAFAGQGIVAEVLNFSKLKGYRTGGTVHFIINNQIGFTTDPSEARSSRYCTDVAKMIEAPIFHVNGDDPEAMVYVTELALAYRQEFGEDVVIDMYCYRRHGHNEADEPKFTQPILYKQIETHPLISETYAERLQNEDTIDEDHLQGVRTRHETALEKAFHQLKKEEEESPKSAFKGSNAVFQPGYYFKPTKTAVTKAQLTKVAEKLTKIPDTINANPKILRQLETKWKNFNNDNGIDWAFGEALAFGTLLLDGSPVRLSGQDSERGTFSQRHAAIYDIETRERYVPLLNLAEDQAQICLYNSLLSEAAVLGFDYGYSLDYPEMLCIWEAQFGDFANGAQVIIDQFITSSESKWQRVSGLVMLLPHGYEGQGPEHSSARLERFLQACGDHNIQVCNLSTPAQYFHALRRQVKRSFRKPMIVMSPKSLLRHKACVSKISEFTKGGFESILPDPNPPKKARRVILCSGKVFYDLTAYREEKEIKDAAIVRVEQFYPLNEEKLANIVDGYDAPTLVWCQEEPENMGAWSFLAPRIEKVFGKKALYAGRDEAASPAVGSLARHKIEQNALVEQAFSIEE